MVFRSKIEVVRHQIDDEVVYGRWFWQREGPWEC